MKFRFFKLFVVPLLLVIGYLSLLSFPHFFSKINRYDSLGLLSVVEEKTLNFEKTLSPQRKADKFDNHLLKGEIISGKIKSTENNFGILLFRFAKLSNIVSDKVVFRIKRGGENKWYYENNYKANQFQPDEYFTFGFPPISESKNKSYVFELESTSGTYKNGIGISMEEPQTALVYKYAKNDLKNANTLSSFVYKKFVYVARNVNFLQNWQLLLVFILPLVLVLAMEKKRFKFSDIFKVLPYVRKNRGRILKVIVKKVKSQYFSFERKITKFSKRESLRFSKTEFYLKVLNTTVKKRLAIGLFIFLFAFTYRFSASLLGQPSVSLFYDSLGGQSDYDHLIRAATCALNFCSAILGQNMPFQAPILGIHYKIFGFTEGLKAYVYVMIILSSVVATFPYFLLSRKNWFSMGGIIGGFFLATSDFLTKIALSFPPDNGSLFFFSVFFIVYLLTLNYGTLRWLLFFGFMGFFDGMFKALFLISDSVALALFAPIFFYEKTIRKSVPAHIKSLNEARKQVKSLFKKKNLKILFLSVVPLIVFLILYVAWEYLMHIKFAAPYFLRGLIESGGSAFVSYTSLSDSSFTESILSQLFYLSGSGVLMLKRIIEFSQLEIFFLAPIFIGLFFFTFRKVKIITKKFTFMSIPLILIIVLLILIKNNYFNVHEVLGDYIYAWTDNIYINISLFMGIIYLSILKFKYSAIKLALPIIPYVVMLIILTPHSPFARLSTHVIVWSVILLSFLINHILMSINKDSKSIKIIMTSTVLILFVSLYVLPKTISIATNLSSGLAHKTSQATYLKWAGANLPSNAVILAGGKSDLVDVAKHLKRPIIYSSLWSAAVVVRPNEIPGVWSEGFRIIAELQNKDNFKKNTYIILEDDVHVWRARLSGTGDGIFTTDLQNSTSLHANDFTLNIYKFNPTLKKAIYKLNIRDASVN